MHRKLIHNIRHEINLLHRFLFMVIFIIGGHLNAQDNFYEKVFTTDHGLPHNHVLSIAQDKTGFLWIGTWDGLSRYDGYEFHNYFHDPEDTTSIPLFNIGTIKVDKNNNIWIFSLHNVIAHYVKVRDNFKRLDYQSDSVLSKTGIENIAIGPDSCLWIAGQGGLARNTGNVNKFDEVNVIDQKGNPIKLSGAFDITFDSNDRIWISTLKDFAEGKIEKGTGTIIVRIVKIYGAVDFGKVIVPNSFRYVYGFVRDDHNAPWVLSNIGGRKLREDFLTPEVSLTLQPESIKPRTKGTIWYRNNNFLVVLSENGDRTSIQISPDEHPTVLCVDDNQSIWYSTITSSGMGTGLHRYDRTPDLFTHFLAETDSKPSVVYSILKDKNNNLLIGTQGNNYIACINDQGIVGKFNELNPYEAARTRHARSIIGDSEGIWMGYMQYRLDYYDYKKNIISNIFLSKGTVNVKEPYSFRSLFKDSRGNLLAGTEGLFLYTPHGNRKFEKIWESTPPGKNIYSITEDPQGIIWVGSSKLLLRLNQDYTLDSAYTVSDNEYNIEDICFGDSGKIWLGLLGGGLEHFDPVTGIRKFYTTKDGLSNNTIYSILKDKRGCLWISTDNGISQFDPLIRKFKTFGYTDGLRIHEFNSDAAFLAPDGRMFFGGMGGVVGFYPDSILETESQQFNGRLILTEFRVSGIPRHSDVPIFESKSITLNKGEDNFGVTFANLDFKNSEKIKYRYKLSRHNENWIESDHLHRSISFAGLRPRKYVFQLESGIEGEYTTELALEVIIPPYFYQTTWFIVLIILSGIIIIGMLFLLNTRQIRIKETQKQHFLKLESIRGQMNPHFIFNSLNSINYFIAKSDRLSANRYISNFSKLIRSFLNNMSQEYISLNDEIASIHDYLKLEFLRFGDKFDYRIKSNCIEESDKWEVFPGMVQPFIENAIWHGVRGLQYRKGFIEVSFMEDESGLLQCMITDDGIGRKLSERNKNIYTNRKSKGLHLIHERMQIINHLRKRKYQISIQDLYPEEEECGTKVIIDIPARLKHFS